MKLLATATLLSSLACLAQAQPPAYQTDPGYQKAMAAANEADQHRRYIEEMGALKDADKKSHNASPECLNKLMKLQTKIGDFKGAASTATHLESIAQNPADKVAATLWRGLALVKLNQEKPNHDQLDSADKDLKQALALSPDLNIAHFLDGQALALMKQDEAARAEFKLYIDHGTEADTYHERAIRFAAEPSLAREKLAPAFSIVTADGKPLSLDGLHGRVVLIDFWATWCGPCRNELPHIKSLAHKFAGRPFVVLSISLDKDETKWKDFINKNEMTWPQYNDPQGKIATMFAVRGIPHYFTIDTDGILRSENIGGESYIDGRIKKLVEQAEKSKVPATSVAAATAP